MADVKLPHVTHPSIPGGGEINTPQGASIRAEVMRQERDQRMEAAGPNAPYEPMPEAYYKACGADNRGMGGGTFGPNDALLDMGIKKK